MFVNLVVDVLVTRDTANQQWRQRPSFLRELQLQYQQGYTSVHQL